MKRLAPVFFLLLWVGGFMWAQNSVNPHEDALQKLFENADAGEPEALYRLARLYETGFDTIQKDSLKSMALYFSAAEKGFAPAMNYIGFKIYNEKIPEQSLDSALYWIRKAAYQGDVTAAANLGYLLTEGPEIANDDSEALDWLAVAADGGMPAAQMKLVEVAERLGTPKALALLGDAYSKGRGVVYDHEKSIRYFYEAALGGNASAQFIVAELLDFFPDTLKEESAEFWYDMAALGGVTDSESAYSQLYSLPELNQSKGK